MQGDQRCFGTVLRDIRKNISKAYFVQARICAILKGRIDKTAYLQEAYEFGKIFTLNRRETVKSGFRER